jgi:PST family polysaccharide transporter
MSVEPTPVGGPAGQPHELHPDEVARGAVRGTVALMTRAAGLQLLGFAAFIALARLISPGDLGLFTIALAVQQVCQFFVTIGLPSSLIRQESPPGAGEQRALAGFSLGAALLISGGVLLIGFLVLPLAGVESTVVKLTGIACLALPIYATRMIPFVLLARRLQFDRVAMIDVASRLALYAWALPAVAVGLGVYGLVSAIPISAMVSSVLASRTQPWARGFSLDLPVVSRHVRFGVQAGVFRFLLNSFLQFGLVVAFSIVGNIALAGFYGLTRRVLGIPFMAVEALQRVGLPAFARVQAGTARTRGMAKATAVSAVGVGAILAVLAGSAQPLVTSLFGTRWLPAADIIILSSPGLLLFASVGSVIAGRALADGDVSSPLIAVGIQIPVTLGLAAILVPGLEAEGAGLSMSAGYLVYVAILFARFNEEETRSAAWSVLRALLVAGGAAAAGQAMRVGDGLVELAVAISVSGVAWSLLALLLTRSELFSLVGMLRRHLGPGRRQTEEDLERGMAEGL